MHLFSDSFAELTKNEQFLSLAIRILLALLCGGLVGWERSKRFKDAGVRTYCLVSVGAAAMIILSKYGFTDISHLTGVEPADASRIGSQVVSGVGFLGAAVIFRRENSIHGLTTAAGLWTISAVGMMIGAGMYKVGLLVTLVIVVFLNLMHRFSVGNDAYMPYKLTVIVEDTEENHNSVLSLIKQHDAVIVSSRIFHPEKGLLGMELQVRSREEFTHEEIYRLMRQYPGIRSFTN